MLDTASLREKVDRLLQIAPPDGQVQKLLLEIQKELIESERRDPELSIQREAIDRIVEERKYQRQRWGSSHDQRHTPEEWFIILQVWMGKLGRECPFYSGEDWYERPQFLKRLVQVGAIAAAAYEAIRRRQARE